MKKAQINALIGIVLGVMAIIITTVMMPVLIEFVEIGLNYTNSTENGSLIAIIYNLYPFIIVMVVLLLVILLILGR